MQPTTFNCSRCNAPLPPGVITCPNCGQTFAAPVPAYAPAPVKKGLGVPAILAIGCALGCLPMIAIVAAVLFPVFVQAREKAREQVSVSNLKIIGLSTAMYTEDYDDKLPPTDTMDHFEAAINPYIPKGRADKLFIEPGVNQEYVLNGSISSKDTSKMKDPSTVRLMWEPSPHRDGLTAVLFVDGHVELQPGTGSP